MLPTRLELKNFKSHSHSVIDFDFSSALITGEKSGDPRKSNGSGKCLPGYTMLTNPETGERISIKDLYDNPRPWKVSSLDADLKRSTANVVAVAHTGTKSILKITTERAQDIFVSTTHPLMTGFLKFDEASALRVGSSIATPGNNSDIYWDVIVRIEHVGEDETYDIEIDSPTHVYALDHVYTHNSSLLEAFSFALFSETGDKNSDDIVKHGQVSCEVILDFTHDGESYQIKRIRNAKYSKVITEFWKTTNGAMQKLHGDTNKLTDAAICDVIKCNYDVFLNSVYFRQGSFFDFTQGTFSTRQALLGSLLNLEDWSKYQKLAKQNFDRLDGEIATLRQQLLETENSPALLADAESELTRTVNSITTSQSTINQLESDITILEDSIGNSSESIRKSNRLKELRDDLARKVRQLEQAKSELADLEKTIREINISAESVALSKVNRESSIAELETFITESNLPAKLAELDRMESALVDGKAKSRQIETQLSTLKGGDTCYTCGHTWSDSHAKMCEIELKSSELATLTAKIARAESKTKSVKAEVEAIRSKSVELEKLRLGLKNLADEAARLGARKASAENLRSAKLEDILNLEGRHSEMTREIAAINSTGDLQEDDRITILSLKKQELRTISSSLNEYFSKQGQLTAKIESLKTIIANREKSMAKLSEATKKAVVYSKLTKAFGRDGVQAIIIDNVVDELTRATNNWLVEFSSEPMRVGFITQRQGTKGEWKETFDIEINTRGGPRPWSSLSGGEKFLVSFAIRLALGSIRARRMGGETQLLLLDEVSSSLDPYNIDIFISIIRKLERHMKVLVITHDPALKDQFEHIISVRRDENGSTVC